jgi:hypothetical protein
MKIARQLSRLFFKPANGTGVTPPVPRVPVTTYDGYPLGKRAFPTGTWQMLISPKAHARLMAWHRGSRGLELSGYALLGEPPQAALDRDKLFYVEDILLVCAIQESTGGYTEMPAEQRVQAMMQARAMGYKANQLAWWHQHGISAWSSIDVNTLRQRVHELGLPEVLQTFAFVLTPSGIRARWDQSGPDPEQNIYVDEIPVGIGDPDLLQVIAEAQAEVSELLARRATREGAQEDEATAPARIEMPTPSWKRQVVIFPRVSTRAYQGSFWGNDLDLVEEDELDLAYAQAAADAIEQSLSPHESSHEFVCRRDPDTLVDIFACAECPFAEGCFQLDARKLEAAAWAMLEVG